MFTPETFRDRYLSPYGVGLLDRAAHPAIGLVPPAQRVSEEVAGLYLVGAGTHPGAGLPGVIASAEVLGKLVPDADVPVAVPQRLAAE